MAKEKATAENIRALLIALNPNLFGTNANPIVPQKVKFLLTGVMKKGAGEEKVEKFVQTTNLSEEAKKANPGLGATRYIRITKTDDVVSMSDLKDGKAFRRARRPIPDNLFERNDPYTFNEIVALLKEKDDKGEYKYFTKMEPTPEGLPRLSLKVPIEGAFVTVQTPAHYRVDANGKKLTVSRRNLATGKFDAPEPAIFRSITIFVYPDQIDNLMAMLLAKYQREVEPLLAEEVTYKIGEFNQVIEKKQPGNAAAEGNDTIVDSETEEESPAVDDLP